MEGHCCRVVFFFLVFDVFGPLDLETLMFNSRLCIGDGVVGAHGAGELRSAYEQFEEYYGRFSSKVGLATGSPMFVAMLMV